MHVVVRRVALHVLVELRVIGVAPFLVLVDCERYRVVEHRCQCVYERDLSDRAREEVWAGVEDCADEQATGAAPANRQMMRTRISLCNQLAGACNEVVEGVRLAQKLAVFVPLPPQLAATPYMGDRINETPVQ